MQFYKKLMKDYRLFVCFLFCFYLFEIHAKIAFQHKMSNKSAYKIVR